MNTRNVLYAAVGAPVVAARKVGAKAGEVKSKLSEGATEYTQVAGKAIDSWAVEGEKVVGKISDGKVVEEISSKVDLDQAKVQVSKLRDQLEDMLATWKTSFRPEKASDKETPAKAPAKKPAAKADTTPKTSAAKTSGSTAAKTGSAKTNSAQAEKAS
jgi:hypothetical protein